MFLLHRLHCQMANISRRSSLCSQTNPTEGKKKKKKKAWNRGRNHAWGHNLRPRWRWGIRWPAGFGVNTHTLCSNHVPHSRKHGLALSWSSWPHLYFCGVTVVMRGPPEACTWMLIVGSVYGCKDKQGTRLMSHHSRKDRQHFWINHSRFLLITEVICNMTISRVLWKELSGVGSINSSFVWLLICFRTHEDRRLLQCACLMWRQYK